MDCMDGLSRYKEFTMQLLDLIQADGLVPKKVASTNGGEYHCPCPRCGGKDRFIIWDKVNRYLCRRCEKKGDIIQYLRDFHMLSYSAACARVGTEPKLSQLKNIAQRNVFEPKVSEFPSFGWRQSASEFIKRCHQNLFNNSYAVGLFLERGFNPKTMKSCQVGWNPHSLWISRDQWGFSNNEHKKLWLPKGLVLPTFDADTNEPIKLKIRRDEWEETDQFPKYVEIPGGMQTPSRYGKVLDKPIMVVESEFDAILISQVAGDIVTCMALGGASKRPDAEAHALLMRAPLIFFSLDVDSAGAIAYQWWKKVYPHVQLWLPPIGKSPGDAYLAGIDLREWVKDANRNL
ncbi:MAG: zinc-binding protein [Chlamydiae bacterium]|nr:zinc-binding protein [Chlamydiota bacterium]